MSIQQAIEARIAEFLADDNPKVGWVKPAVSGSGFLPLYFGWVAVIGIRPNGSFVWWEIEAGHDAVRTLLDPKLERMAICQGAKLYPELAVLIPLRPREATSCEACNGTGQVPGHPHWICNCGGVGWNIPGERSGQSPG
jgi:hypothetical protein